MKRTALIKKIKETGCVLVRHGARHDWYRNPETGLYVGYVPGFPGAHSQAATLDELNMNLREVMGMLLEDGEPILEGEFVGTQRVALP